MESGLDDAELIETGQPTGSIVSLADIKASGVTFEWFEALATTLQLCHGIAESPEPTGPTTLSPDTVFIAPAGDVIALTHPQHPSTAVPRVAGIFGDLLPDFHRRSTFRVVLAEATSIPPGYASLAELAQALEPFERPNRVQIVQGVYQRWQAIAALTESPESDALDSFLSETVKAKTVVVASIPKAAAAVVKSLAWRPIWQRQSASLVRASKFLLRASALAVVVMAVLGIGVWAWRSSRRPTVTNARDNNAVTSEAGSIADVRRAEAPPDSAEAIKSPDQSSQSAKASAPAPSPADARGVATSRVAAATTAPVKSAPGAPRAVPPARSIQSVQAVRSGQGPPEDPATRAEPPAQSSAVALDGRTAVLAAPGVPPALSQAPPSATAGIGIAATTFSASDPDVVPPVPDSSQQLWRMPASTRRSDLVTIEIVVDERGAVQSVKATHFPDSLADTAALMMSLSAVKSWHFSPALKDGRPVKFRQMLSLTMR